MRLIVNGAPRALPARATLADLAAELGLPGAGVAVAVDGDVVPRTRWAGHVLADGDRVEIVTAVPGG